MRAIERDEMWDLLDPNDGSVRDSMKQESYGNKF